MKLGSKFMSKLAAIALIGSCTAFPAYACSNCNPPTNEVHGMGDLPIYYTLEDLFAMSNEEFLALDEALPYEFEEYKKEVNTVPVLSSDSDSYERVDIDTVGENDKADWSSSGLSGHIFYLLGKEDMGVKYTANITEDEITEVLGDTVKYSIESPLCSLNDTYAYYYNLFSVTFSDYDIPSTKASRATDKEIIEFMKCKYCVNQVCPDLGYYACGDDLGISPADEEIITGDVNLDRKVNATDVDYMEKGLSGELALTDAQKKIADVNGDGKFDTLDVEKLKSEVADTTEPTIQTETVPANVEASRYGDINGDSEVNVSDVVHLNLFLLNADKYPLTDVQIANADCHKDGVIDSSDSTLLMNYVAEIIEISELGK